MSEHDYIPDPHDLGEEVPLPPEPTDPYDDADSDETPKHQLHVVTTESQRPSGRSLDRGDFRSVPMGERLAADLKDRFRYLAGFGWLEWDTTRWKLHERDKGDAAMFTAASKWALSELQTVVQQEDSNVLRYAARYRDEKPIRDLIAVSRANLIVTAQQVDADQHLLATPGGTLDLNTGNVTEPDPALLITRATNVKYRPGATHPDWDRALECVPAETARFLQERFGQSIFGEPTPSDELVILRGGGSNGKTAVLGTITAALGDYAKMLPDSVLISNANSHTTDLTELRGARLAIIEELPEGHRLNMTRVKKIIGTFHVVGRRMHSDNISFPTTHSLFVSSNYRPRITETDHGSWRRLLMVEFKLTYREKDQELRGANDRRQEVELRRRLLEGTEQQEAALAWVVTGARRYYESGRVLSTPPKDVTDTTRVWRGNENTVAAFIDEHLELDPKGVIRTAEVLARYNESQNGSANIGAALFTSKFLDQDLIADNAVTAKRRNRAQVTSEPPGTMHTTPGAKSMCWLGLKWRP